MNEWGEEYEAKKKMNKYHKKERLEGKVTSQKSIQTTTVNSSHVSWLRISSRPNEFQHPESSLPQRSMTKLMKHKPEQGL